MGGPTCSRPVKAQVREDREPPRLAESRGTPGKKGGLEGAVAPANERAPRCTPPLPSLQRSALSMPSMKVSFLRAPPTWRTHGHLDPDMAALLRTVRQRPEGNPVSQVRILGEEDSSGPALAAVLAPAQPSWHSASVTNPPPPQQSMRRPGLRGQRNDLKRCRANTGRHGPDVSGAAVKPSV